MGPFGPAFVSIRSAFCILKASVFYFENVLFLFQRFCIGLMGLFGPPFVSIRPAFSISKTSVFDFESFCILVWKLLYWFHGALRAPFFKYALPPLFWRLLYSILKASLLLSWGSSGPFFKIRSASSILKASVGSFESFCILFLKLLHWFSSALRALFFTYAPPPLLWKLL